MQGTKADAGNDLKISSGTDTIITTAKTTTVRESGDYGIGQKWSTRVTNDLAQLKAANDVSITSGLDTVANGIEIDAGNDVNVSSLASTSITSVQDSLEQNIKTKKYTLIVDKKDTVRSTIKAGNDVNINATLGDVTLKAAEVKAGGKVTLAALNGDVNLTSNKDVDFRHEIKTETGGMWTTFSDRGRLDEKVQHTKIDAGDGLTITVGTNGTVNVDYKDFGDLDKSIDRLSKEPGLAWMAQVKDGATPAQWNAIQEAHKSWDYSSQSLSPQAAMIITMIATIATMGAGSVLAAGTSASTQSLGGLAAAKMGIQNAVLKAAVAAGVNSLAVSATVSLVGNKGNLGATLKQLGSKESIRSLATAMVTAGLLQGVSGATGINMNATDLPGRIQAAALRMTVNTAVQSTIGGQDLSDSLKMNLIMAGTDVIGGELSEQIGDAFKNDPNNIAKYLAHAVVGCAGGAALGDDCGSGAAGAVISEVVGEVMFSPERTDAFAQELNSVIKNENLTDAQAFEFINSWKQQGVEMSRLTAGLAVALAGGDGDIAATTGGIAVENNLLQHLGKDAVLKLITYASRLATGGSLVYGAYDVHKAYQEQGPDAALEVLVEDGAITLALGASGKVGYKIADKVYDKASDAWTAYKLSTNRSLDISTKQLQKKFKHASNFGVNGNYNSSNAQQFENAVQNHVLSPKVKPISGTYKGQPVTHYLDPKTGLNVIKDSNGKFVSGWKLGSAQLENVLKHGGLN